jgi:hypothetical protein
LIGANFLACAFACDGAGEGMTIASSVDAGSENTAPHVTIRTVVDVFERCGPSGSQFLSFRATRIGCERPPPTPCTIAVNPYDTVFGDTRNCEQASETAAPFALELERAGRYQLEIVALTDSGEVRSCLGPDGEAETLITSDQLEAREIVTVAHLGGGPCPDP